MQLKKNESMLKKIVCFKYNLLKFTRKIQVINFL